MKIHNPNYIKFGLIFLFLGFLGLGLPFIYEFLLSEKMPVQELSSAAQVQLPTFEDSFISYGEDFSVTPVPTPITVKDRLVIASVNINMPVFLGDPEKTL